MLACHSVWLRSTPAIFRIVSDIVISMPAIHRFKLGQFFCELYLCLYMKTVRIVRQGTKSRAGYQQTAHIGGLIVIDEQETLVEWFYDRKVHLA